MQISKAVEEIRSIVNEWKANGYTVGFVPTMGYLHEGHESLIKKASLENDKVVVSIFINPLQFNSKHDFETYPEDINSDLKRILNSGGDILFNPSYSEIYPEGFATFVDINNLSKNLCGSNRENHFRGVCTVVSKLFNIVPANRAYFGQKDAQQLAIIKRMVKDLNFDIQIVPCETIREKDGLAKSSRNVRLNFEERKAATIIYKSLSSAQLLLDGGEKNPSVVINHIKDILTSEKLASIEYIQIVDSESLIPVEEIGQTVLVAVAVNIGSTRLIDNFSY